MRAGSFCPRSVRLALVASACFILSLAAQVPPADALETPAGWTLLVWNDLGMHCVDEDFSVFAILPPFNTLNAQLLDPTGAPVGAAGGVSLRYEAVHDLDGSITQTAQRSNFWDYAPALFGANLATGEGLAGSRLPGPENIPQPMHWIADQAWWEATGIPVLPVNESGFRQAYPLFRVTARDGSGQLLAESHVVAPVSAEMNCVQCHGSSAGNAARPPQGWVNDPDPVRDYRLNILKLHDEREADNPAFAAALAARGYDPAGLFATVTTRDQPILCASCHGTVALGAPGVDGVPPMTAAMHGRHATVNDPETGVSLGAAFNRESCYQCHPGRQTRCLRGAMGSARAPDGGPAMSCQSCHGGMTAMAAPARTGWLDEPNCQSCHTGTATANAGAIRLLEARLGDGSLRPPVDPRFATTADAPAAGFSLYRFSKGHGGLNCSACHGSPHAIYPTSERNDNLQSLDRQGHVGTISDCSTCHQNGVQTADKGPHGMHAIGAWWIGRHGEGLEHNTAALAACRACHGADDRGSELSRAQGPRQFSAGELGLVNFWEGQTIGCYECHRGPGSDDRNTNARPVAHAQRVTTLAGVTAVATLQGSDADDAALTFRIVDPPDRGSLSLAGDQVAYTPAAGFVGTDSFTFAVHDGQRESNLGVVQLVVGPAAATADPDHDGQGDLIERALGTKRDRPQLQPIMQSWIQAVGPGETRLELRADLRLVPPDLRVLVEWSEDLESWSGPGGEVAVSTDYRGRTVLSVPAPASSAQPRFVRLRAESIIP